MSSRQSKHAFTLIEFLAVVFLILLLVGFLLPAHRGGGPSSAGRCWSNQQQLAVAATIYANDFDERFANLDGTTGNDGPIALTLFAKYAYNRTNIFMCPAVVKDREKSRSWYQLRFVPQLNTAFFDSNGNDYAYYDGLSVSTNIEPLIADRGAWTTRKTNVGFLNHPAGIAIVAYADGHVQMLKAGMVIGTNLTPPWSAIQDPLPVR